MSLPEQIQKQVDEAKTIIEQHYGTGENQGLGEPGREPESDEQDDEGSQSPESTVGNEAPRTQAAQQAEDENSLTFKQRWLSLQGQWNAARGQNEQLMQRIGQLENLITTMSNAPAPQHAPQQETADYSKDVEDYGQDMVDFAKRVSRQENAALQAELERTQRVLVAMEQRLNGMQQQVVPAVQQVVQKQRISAEQEFFHGVAQHVPQWERVNADPRFHQWLLTPDPMTGITRQTYLEDAQRNHDVARVVNIFRTFAPSAGTPPQNRPNPAASELERQIAPGRTVAANSPSTQEAKRWSRTEITKLYDDHRKGNFKGREAEFKELERDLFAAQRDGRIAA
jgi:hypothetical protein